MRLRSDAVNLGGDGKQICVGFIHPKHTTILVVDEIILTAPFALWTWVLVHNEFYARLQDDVVGVEEIENQSDLSSHELKSIAVVKVGVRRYTLTVN